MTTVLRLIESGRTNEIYNALRETIGNHVGKNTIPDTLKEESLIKIPEIQLTPAVNLFDSLPKPVTKQAPVNMEALGQSTGLTLYRHVITTPINGTLAPGRCP